MAQDWKDSLPKKRLSKRFKFSSGGAQSLGNTGTGENGRLEPSKPVAMFQTADGPRMVHEGEDMQKLPNGDIQVIPASQSQLGQLERQGVQGYALGGTMRSHGGGHHDAFLGSQSGVSSNPFKATPEQQTVDAPTLNLGAPVANAPAPQQTVDIAPPQQQRTVGLGLDVGAPVTTSNTAAGDVTPTTTTPTIGESAVARGLGGLEAIAAGESPVDRTIANRTLGNLGAQQEADRMAAIQNQAQQGVTGPAAQAQQAMLGITQGSQMGQVAGELAQGAQERAAQGTRDLATIGQAQQAQEFAQGMTQVGFLVDNGDFRGAAQAFQQLTGNGADMSNAEEMFNEALLSQKANRISGMINNFASMLEYLDEDTAAGVGALLAKVQMGAVQTIGSDLLTEDDWNQLSDFFEGTGDVPETDSAQQYLKTANDAISRVSDSDAWLNLQLERPELFDGSDENTQVLGKIAGALIRQTNGSLTDDARSTLEEYGLYNPALDVQDALTETDIAQTRTDIGTALSLGNITEAERLYNELPDEERDEVSFVDFVGNNVSNLLNPSGGLVSSDQNFYREMFSGGIPTNVEASGAGFDWENMLKWVNPSGAGNAHWELKPDIIAWADANMGKAIDHPSPAQPNRRLVLTGYYQPGPDNEDEKGYLTFYDPATGKSFNYGGDPRNESGGVGRNDWYGKNVPGCGTSSNKEDTECRYHFWENFYS